MIAGPFMDIWTGDLGALMGLWILMLPFILVAGVFGWVRDKWRNR